MRDIKFRAWDKRAKQMYQVKNLGLGKESWLRTATNYGKHPETGYNKFYPSEVEIMQYTGLKDKNGVEIYEGDIISNGYEKCIVVWVKEYAGFMLKLINKEYEDKEWTNPIIDLRKDEVVIGNIYDNPELLEKGEKQ